MRFDVVALDRASATFVKMAEQVDRVQRRLDEIDGRQVSASVVVDTEEAESGVNDLSLKVGAGLVAAATSGGVGAAAGLAILPPLFAGIAALALSSNARVAGSYSELGKRITNSVQADAAVLEGTFVGAAVKIGAGFDRLRPQLRDVFADVGPQVDLFTDGVIGLAENAMPGLVEAVDAADPVFAGLKSLLESTGTGLAGFFSELADGAESSGSVLASLGGAVEDLLPFVGRLFAFLSDVGSGALPVFASGLGAVLNVVSGVMDVLEPAAPVLGTVAGALLLAAVASKALALGAAGVAAYGAAATVAASQVWLLTTALTGSSTVGLVAAGAFRAAATALPLVGIAVLGLSLAFRGMSTSVDEATTALGKGGTAAVEANVALREQDEHLKRVREQLPGFVADAQEWIESNIFGKASTADVNAELAKQRSEMTEVQRAQRDVTAAQGEYQIQVDKFTANSPQARAAADELAAATEREKDARFRAAEAAKTQTDRLIDLQNQQLAAANADVGYRQALLDQKRARDDAAEAVKQYGVNSDEAQAAGLRLESADLRVVGAAGLLARETNSLKGETVANTRANEAQTGQIIDMALAAETRGSPTIQAMAANLTDAQIEAQKAALETAGFATEVRILPDGRRVYIAVDPETNEVIDLNDRIDGLPDKVQVVVEAIGRWQAANPQLFAQLATGGIVPGYTPGRDIYNARLSGGEAVMRPEWTRAVGPEYVHAANAAARSGGIPGVMSFMERGAPGRAFAEGGIYPYTPEAVTAASQASVSATADRMAAVVKQGIAASAAVGGAVGGAFTGNPGRGVERWRGMVNQSLGIMGQPLMLANTTLRRMNQESGGNPNIVNMWDINAKRGTPSVGLMQVIGPTYRAYRHPRFDVGPYSYGTSVNPLANTLASMRYALARYGSLPAAYNKRGGYADGGIVTRPTFGLVGEAGPEAIVPLTRPARAAEVMAQAGLGGGSTVVKQYTLNLYPMTADADSVIEGFRRLERLG